MNTTDNDSTIISFGNAERERLEFVFPSGGRHTQGWLHSKITISAGPFSGATDAYCEPSDFARLPPELEGLYDRLRGVAKFETIEGQIGFTLTGDGLGHITLSGFLEDCPGGSNRLNFSIEFDQTLLLHSIPEIRAFLTANSQ
jgi:hypothetical protein